MDLKAPFNQEPEPVQSAWTKPEAPAPSVERPEPQSQKAKLMTVLRRNWWIPAIAAVVIGLGMFLFLQHQSNERKWAAATDYYGKAQYDKAAAQLKNIKMPSDEKRLTVYAQTMLAVRKLDKALPAYQALYKKNKSPDTLIKIGNVYNEQKNYDKAIETYQSVINKDSGYVQAYVNLATVQRLQNRPEAAIATAKKGVEANPGSVVMHELYISMLLEKQDSAEFKAAVAALKKLNPGDPLLVSLEQ